MRRSSARIGIVIAAPSPMRNAADAMEIASPGLLHVRGPARLRRMGRALPAGGALRTLRSLATVRRAAQPASYRRRLNR